MLLDEKNKIKCMYVCMRPAKKQKQKQNDVLYMDEKKKKKCVCCVCCVCVCVGWLHACVGI